MPEEVYPLKISINRRPILGPNPCWAVFDSDFRCVKDFVDYTDEAAALAEAKAWVKQSGLPGADLEPEVVYPNITKVRMS